MAGLKIEGDCSDITDKQLEFIKSAIEKQGYKDNKVIIEPLGKSGDNFIANVKRIIVEDGNGGTLKMVVKIAPQFEMLRKFINTEFLFNNEHIMYTKILSKYSQLEKTHNVPIQDRLRFPICYGSSNDAPNEVLLLEDLNELNFKMLDKLERLNNDCIRSVLKNIAQLHALGFTLKHKEPELFDEYKSGLFDVASNMYIKEQSKILFKAMESSVLNILENDRHKQVIQGIVLDPVHGIGAMSKNDIGSKYAIIQHGDAWTNNFLFQFDGDEITQSILIDYQAAKDVNPAFDILFMISSCTDYESRKLYYKEWIDFYYSVIDKTLSRYSLRSDIVYPRKQLDIDLKRYARAALGHTIIMIGLFSLKNEEAEIAKEALLKTDLDAIALHGGAATSKDPETVAFFKKTVEGLVDSYYELGLI